MTKKSSVVVKEIVQSESESENESVEESPVEKPKKKREYIMTPAREQAIKRMVEARQKKAKEARINKELNKIETKEQQVLKKKEKLTKYKESEEYIPPKPKPKPKKKLVEVFSSEEEDSPVDDYKEYIKQMKAKTRVEKVKPQPKVRHSYKEQAYEYTPPREEFIYL